MAERSSLAFSPQSVQYMYLGEEDSEGGSEQPLTQDSRITGITQGIPRSEADLEFQDQDSKGLVDMGIRSHGSQQCLVLILCRIRRGIQ